jgi:sugar/nucleoside kinase (ribokinase family)
MGAGVSLLVVTLGPKGAAYVANTGFAGFAAGQEGGGAGGQTPPGRPAAPLPLRSALVPAVNIEMLDPTGCGDVFGAAAAARLFAGVAVEEALRHATTMAARNAAFRGAGGLSRHLRGLLVTP